MNIPKKIIARKDEITIECLKDLDKHLKDIVSGKADEMFEINDFAKILYIHPTHLSNTIKLATGKSACYYFEEKLLNIAKSMLQKNETTISSIASLLTYDPSNFTKFFKRFAHTTPTKYREEFLNSQK
jgi:AraC family transcriptional regulator, regulatory protein of adaptative response / methylphosphotriester-DNA alkyltransferase methyltransferase